MAPVELPCTVGGSCTFKTIQLEFEQAKALLDSHLKYAHQATGGSNSERKPEKFPRPDIKLDSSQEEWSEFLVMWRQYKEEYNLAGSSLIRQLFACCSEELRHSLSRSTGGSHFNKSEKQLLELMKQLAVQYQNPAVHVQEFLGLVQQQDEGVRHYVTRLRGVASRCNLTEKCSCTPQTDVSYADSMIRFKLIAGLYDTEIKEDILSVEDKTLEETIKAVKAKESGKIAKKTVGATSVPNVPSVKPVLSQQVVRCGHCNRTGHGSSLQEREKKCPAFSKDCGNCGRKGHYRVVCKSRSKSTNKSNEANPVEEATTAGGVCLDNTYYLSLPGQGGTGAINSVSFGEIAGLMYSMEKISSDVNKINKLKVPHMLHDQLKWTLAQPPPQPFIKLQVRVDTKAYKYHSFKPPSPYRHRSTEIPVLADLGCQACCMGPRELSKLGLMENDLLQVEMKLNGANGSQLRILGGVFLVISGTDADGKLWETNQLCYVAEGVEKLLLSKEACVKLAILPKSFPSVGSAVEGKPIVGEVSDGPSTDQFELEPCAPDEDGLCSCPRREPVPEPPVFDPNLSAPKLRKMIIQHYASSAFNKFTRQKLPLMKGDPLPIPVRKDVKPVAVHTPVPVPLHWEEKVHRDLMRDVSLGVIEPVPINTPVTWCHRMVTVPKHSGETRRTVDMQSLNKASVRQTHHTRSPFMLASSVPAGKVKSVMDVSNSFHSVPLAEITCAQCEIQLPSRQALYRHNKSKHNHVLYECEKCNFFTSRQDHLKRHIQSKHDGVKYECNLCDYNTTRQDHLKRHVQSKHEDTLNATELKWTDVIETEPEYDDSFKNHAKDPIKYKQQVGQNSYQV